jgi:hypothetical protein
LGVNYIGTFTFASNDHAVVMFGYVSINPRVSAADEYRYLIADPVKNSDYAFRMFSYFNLYRDDSSDLYAAFQPCDWKSAVVFSTDYSGSYIPAN